MLDNFFENKKILITGHTGFKGALMCQMLNLLGSEVYGYSLEPPTEPNLFNLLNLNKDVISRIGDVRDYERLESFYSSVKPDIVIHMAAQPLVREGYREPRLTFETNVMGTVNILECARLYGAKSFLNVTTDKVYMNEDSGKLYREDDCLNGADPYSNSKSCSDIITRCYANSYNMGFPISTARAGNVIGGGDFAADRIVPDCVRAMIGTGKIILRNPDSVRPYQHVFEPLYAYLTILKRQNEDPSFAESYNIGPDSDDIITTRSIVNKFETYWGKKLDIVIQKDNSMKEAKVLRLDNTKLKNSMALKPLWNIDDAISRTVEWTKEWSKTGNVKQITVNQIIDYLGQRGERIERFAP